MVSSPIPLSEIFKLFPNSIRISLLVLLVLLFPSFFMDILYLYQEALSYPEIIFCLPLPYCVVSLLLEYNFPSPNGSGEAWKL